MYADIIVDISQDQLDRPFQYRIPPHLEGEVGIGVMVNVPFGKGNRLITGYVIELSETPALAEDKIKSIISVVPDKVKAVGRMIQLASWLRHTYGSTMNQALKTVLPVKEKIKQKEKKTICLCATRQEALEYRARMEKKNATARVRLIEALIEQSQIDSEIIKSKLHITMQTVRALEAEKLIRIESETLYRNPIAEKEREHQNLHLNPEQSHIVESVMSDYDAGIRKTYLIHGVTGSGKTLCYLEMIEQVVAGGKQVIMLIPEIALTYQTVQRFYTRFGDRVSILNSRMSKGERYDQFLRAMRGEISIMIGPRSALFTPFPNIGLIVIDEEHENAYKSEQSPRYHARETAIHIAQTFHASVVLGSATPSMEAYYRAKKGEYQLFELPNRAVAQQLPTVYTVDLREELRSGNRSIFSRKLQELIADRLQKGQQIMLFLNKRGYAGFISCRSCGHVMKCPHCDISLTSHNNGKLVCHYCGYEQPGVSLCPKCGSKYISGFRAGTQQIEELVQKMFVGVRTLRMDMDTTAGKEGHERILSAFANHEADVLIGTQMIVKGHDFPQVTLVGIIAADMSLYAGDYRASERTFALLTQAAGRAGRGAQKGEVVIQTYTPENYSIITAANQDYQSFYEQEIIFRNLMGYPPVMNILLITLSSKNEDQLEAAANHVANIAKTTHFPAKMNLIGPTQASIYKLKDFFHMVIYAKSPEYDSLTLYKDRVEIDTKNNSKFHTVNIQFDFN